MRRTLTLAALCVALVAALGGSLASAQSAEEFVIGEQYHVRVPAVAYLTQGGDFRFPFGLEFVATYKGPCPGAGCPNGSGEHPGHVFTYGEADGFLDEDWIVGPVD